MQYYNLIETVSSKLYLVTKFYNLVFDKINMEDVIDWPNQPDSAFVHWILPSLTCAYYSNHQLEIKTSAIFPVHNYFFRVQKNSQKWVPSKNHWHLIGIP